MKNHDEIPKLLPAYCGGDLDPTERMRVEEHLNCCTECGAVLADLETALRLIRSTPMVEPPPWMTSRIMACLREEIAAKKSWPKRIFFPLHIKLPLEFLALLIVCVSGYFLVRNVQNEMREAIPRIQEAPAPSKALELMPRARDTAARSQKAARSMEVAVGKKAGEPSEREPLAEPSTTHQPLVRPISPAVSEPVAPRDFSAHTPAPARNTRERGESSTGTNSDPQPETDRMRSYDRAGNAESVSGKKTAKGFEKKESKFAEAVQPPRRLRLDIDDPATAGEAIRRLLGRSGGSLVEGDRTPSGRRLKARIPAARLTEFVGRLERLGSVAERPAIPDSEGLIELDIIW